MSKPKIHYPTTPVDLTSSVCGAYFGPWRTNDGVTHLADDESQVTCARCKTKLAKFGPPPSIVSSPLWLERGTKFDDRYSPLVNASVPGRIGRRYRWPGIDAALKSYVITLCDGYGAKSGSAGLMRFARLGAQVHGGESRESRALSQADDAVAVGKSLDWACAQSDELPARVQRVAVLARSVGVVDTKTKRTRRGHAVSRWAPVPIERLARELETDEAELSASVREARRWLRVDLHARGLVPPPFGGRSLLDAQERRAALEARR